MEEGVDAQGDYEEEAFSVSHWLRAAWGKLGGHGEKGLDLEQFKRKTGEPWKLV